MPPQLLLLLDHLVDRPLDPFGGLDDPGLDALVGLGDVVDLGGFALLCERSERALATTILFVLESNCSAKQEGENTHNILKNPRPLHLQIIHLLMQHQLFLPVLGVLILEVAVAFIEVVQEGGGEGLFFAAGGEGLAGCIRMGGEMEVVCGGGERAGRGRRLYVLERLDLFLNPVQLLLKSQHPISRNSNGSGQIQTKSVSDQQDRDSANHSSRQRRKGRGL